MKKIMTDTTILQSNFKTRLFFKRKRLAFTNLQKLESQENIFFFMWKKKFQKERFGQEIYAHEYDDKGS